MKKPTDNFRGKKVLVFGLGLLGGGVATTNWLIKHGARVTVTDLKDEKYLEPSLGRLKGKPKLRLNGHDKKDIDDNELIVFNPDVSVKNPFVKYARKTGRQIENEATIFYKLCPWPIIAITGTRGKTTTTNWAGHFLNAEYKAVISGNSYVEPLLKTLDSLKPYPNKSLNPPNLFSNSQEFENRSIAVGMVVNEIPSYHLEYFDRTIPPPVIAVITNLYQDHLNRYGDMKEYALAKAAIFRNQSANQHLILNRDNKWTPFFLAQKPSAKVWLFSVKAIPQKASGIFYRKGWVYFQDGKGPTPVLNVGDFEKQWGGHNLQNLLAGSLAAGLAGVPWEKIQQSIKTLPQVPFRQEVIFDGSIKLTAGATKLKIINDTSATSPDGGIAAVNRFAGASTILITGGTDRDLDYKEWVKTVRRKLKPENIILLGGSATDKMLKSPGAYGKKAQVFDTLFACVKAALAKAGRQPMSVILFSPAAKSFEKFKNEFDRGRQFNSIFKKLIKRRK